jgi:hypothetical protein
LPRQDRIKKEKNDKKHQDMSVVEDEMFINSLDDLNVTRIILQRRDRTKMEKNDKILKMRFERKGGLDVHSGRHTRQMEHKG